MTAKTNTTNPNSENKVLMVVTSHDQLGKSGKPTGFWLSELTHPYFALRDAGLAVDIVSIKGGKAPIDPGSVEDKDAANQRFLDDPALKQSIEQSKALSSMEAKQYRAIVFAGGHGTMWDFPNNKAVNDVSRQIYESGGVVAAVCHGPAALVDITLSNGEHLIQGKKVTGFSNEEESKAGLTEVVPFLLEDAMKKRGANFSKAAPWQAHVISDQRIVTGQNPQSAQSLGEAVAKLLK